MNYKVLQKGEHQSLAEIHLDAFHGFFLSSLGENFLNAYYTAALNNDKTIAVCAIDENGLVQGFGTGCIESKGYHKRLLLENFLTFSYQSLILLFTNPKALLRLIRNLDKNFNKKDDGKYAELISIGVSHTCKGLGVGKALIKIFEEEARKKGCKKIALTTDYYNNEKVITFYRHFGYEVFYDFTTFPNRRMYKLIKDI